MASLPEAWIPFSEKYTIHPEVIESSQRAIQCNVKPYSVLGLEAARQQREQILPVFNGTIEFDGDISEKIVPSAFNAKGIPVTIMKPASCATKQDPTILVYFHGGGLVLGSRKTSETALKKIAMDCGIIVVNVEYRLLPNMEFIYACFDDAEVATRWVVEHKDEVGGSTASKIGVGGDSGGGQLALSASYQIKGLDFQCLVYPMADTSRSQASYEEFRYVPGLNRDTINFFFTNSLKHVPDFLTNPRINAMVNTKKGLSPPTLIVLAELDPLRDCGLEYAQRLREEGVFVQCEIVKGVPHAFFTQLDTYKTKCPEAYAHFKTFLNSLNF